MYTLGIPPLCRACPNGRFGMGQSSAGITTYILTLFLRRTPFFKKVAFSKKILPTKNQHFHKAPKKKNKLKKNLRGWGYFLKRVPFSKKITHIF
jgi:hypothetical protein